MPRPKKLDRPARFEITIPESLKTAFELELYSELEGRVPSGKRQTVIQSLIRGWLERRGLEAGKAPWRSYYFKLGGRHLAVAVNLETEDYRVFGSKAEADDFISLEGR